MQMKFPVYCL